RCPRSSNDAPVSGAESLQQRYFDAVDHADDLERREIHFDLLRVGALRAILRIGQNAAPLVTAFENLRPTRHGPLDVDREVYEGDQHLVTASKAERLRPRDEPANELQIPGGVQRPLGLVGEIAGRALDPTPALFLHTDLDLGRAGDSGDIADLEQRTAERRHAHENVRPRRRDAVEHRVVEVTHVGSLLAVGAYAHGGIDAVDRAVQVEVEHAVHDRLGDVVDVVRVRSPNRLAGARTLAPRAQ